MSDQESRMRLPVAVDWHMPNTQAGDGQPFRGTLFATAPGLRAARDHARLRLAQMFEAPTVIDAVRLDDPSDRPGGIDDE